MSRAMLRCARPCSVILRDYLFLGRMMGDTRNHTDAVIVRAVLGLLRSGVLRRALDPDDVAAVRGAEQV